MASKPMWMVCAGRGAYAASDFREKNVVGIVLYIVYRVRHEY